MDHPSSARAAFTCSPVIIASEPPCWKVDRSFARARVEIAPAKVARAALEAASEAPSAFLPFPQPGARPLVVLITALHPSARTPFNWLSDHWPAFSRLQA